MVKHGVDLYLCGEVHAVTCTQRDGIQQIAHGGLTDAPPPTLPDRSQGQARTQPQQIDLVNGKGGSGKGQEQGPVGYHHHHRGAHSWASPDREGHLNKAAPKSSRTEPAFSSRKQPLAELVCLAGEPRADPMGL